MMSQHKKHWFDVTYIQVWSVQIELYSNTTSGGIHLSYTSLPFICMYIYIFQERTDLIKCCCRPLYISTLYLWVHITKGHNFVLGFCLIVNENIFIMFVVLKRSDPVCCVKTK